MDLVIEKNKDIFRIAKISGGILDGKQPSRFSEKELRIRSDYFKLPGPENNVARNKHNILESSKHVNCNNINKFCRHFLPIDSLHII